VSRLGLGARLAFAMTLIAIAATAVAMVLASHSLDSGLERFASERRDELALAGTRNEPRTLPQDFVAAEDRALHSKLDDTRAISVIFALLGGLGAAALVALTLVRPLKRLTEASDLMASGDLGARAEVGGGAEIARLGASFNRLAATLAREDEVRRAATADIAHELRTPVTGMLARIEAAQDGVMPDSKANLAAMHEEALRLARLIEDVGQLAEAEKPALLIEKARVDLGAVARSRAEAHRDFFAAKGIAFSHSAHSVPVYADASRLEQIVDNLLSNALRYTDEGGSVELRVGERRGRAVLEVIDTGIGITAEDLPNVFDRFWRSDRSRSRATGGAGIGLAVVRELVDAHDGDVAVESSAGAGTRFSVSLPALRRKRVTAQLTGRAALVSAAQ